jgi:ribosomal protein S18 acetylase RimI-like enzyme
LIAILPIYQNFGIGRKLVIALMRDLYVQKVRSLLLWVSAQNPACLFYEALCAERVGSKYFQFRESSIEMIGYGWRDISSFV